MKAELVSYHFFLVFTTLSLAAYAAKLDLSKCDKSTKRGDGMVCYRAYQISNNYDNSRKSCQAKNSDLATIHSDDEAAILNDILARKFFNSAWIGLRQTLKPWSWSDGSELSDQGCYHRTYSQSFFSTQTTFDDNSPLKCTAFCRNAGYKYAGLIDGTGCHCGATFQTNIHSQAACHVPCPLEPTSNCGGTSSFTVISIDGGYSSWMMGRPSNGQSGNAGHTCAIMVVQPAVRLSTWMDVGCADKFKTLCEIDLNQDFPTCDTNKQHVHKLTYTKATSAVHKCVYVDTNPKDFFSATQMCANLNGRVVDVEDAEMNEAVTSLLDDASIQEYWVGASKFKQTWTDGSKVTFSKWKDLSYVRQLSCGTINRNNAISSQDNWALDDCSKTKHVICETSNSTYNSKPTFFRTTTSTTTNAPVTKLTDLFRTTTLPTVNITIPSSSPLRPNIVKWASIGGALAGVLILILIAAVIVAVIVKKKHRLPAKSDLEAKKSIFVEPTYFFGTLPHDLTKIEGFDENSCADSGNDCGSSGGCSGGGEAGSCGGD